MDIVDDEEHKLSEAKEELKKWTVSLFAEFSYLSVKFMFFTYIFISYYYAETSWEGRGRKI